MWPRKQGFFFKKLDIAKSDNHPQNNLATFGYNNKYEGKKPKKKQNPFIFLATLWKKLS
jgi:hypothetical protein